LLSEDDGIAHLLPTISLFLRYIQNIKLFGLMSGTLVPFILVSGKGLQLEQFLKKMFAFFIDGFVRLIIKD